MKLMFLGAPGAGKGTQAEIASERYGIPMISTGALIRAAVKAGSALGLEVKKYSDAGLLVPDSIVIDIVRERLAADDCADGFILDGFPRTVAQAKALDDMGIKLDRVVNIDVPDETIINRMSGRRLCGKCSATYHVVHKPSGSGEFCEKCGEKLTTRADDHPDIVKERLRVYHEQTASLIDYYTAKGILRTVIGQERVEETTALTIRAIEDDDKDKKSE